MSATGKSPEAFTCQLQTTCRSSPLLHRDSTSSIARPADLALTVSYTSTGQLAHLICSQLRRILICAPAHHSVQLSSNLRPLAPFELIVSFPLSDIVSSRTVSGVSYDWVSGKLTLPLLLHLRRLLPSSQSLKVTARCRNQLQPKSGVSFHQHWAAYSSSYAVLSPRQLAGPATGLLSLAVGPKNCSCYPP